MIHCFPQQSGDKGLPSDSPPKRYFEPEGCRPVESEVLLNLQKDIRPPPLAKAEVLSPKDNSPPCDAPKRSSGHRYFEDSEDRYDPGSHHEKDVSRMLLEQGIVSKRSHEFESSPSPGPQQPASASAKVGFAAIQEIARKQEEALMRDMTPSPVVAKAEALSSEKMRVKRPEEDLSFLRFDPESNCLKLDFEQPKFAAKEKEKSPIAPSKESSPQKVGKFPLEINTPLQSPQVGLKRFGSFRYYILTLTLRVTTNNPGIGLGMVPYY